MALNLDDKIIFPWSNLIGQLEKYIYQTLNNKGLQLYQTHCISKKRCINESISNSLMS